MLLRVEGSGSKWYIIYININAIYGGIGGGMIGSDYKLVLLYW